ncbi:amino acid ABC transporter permease [Mycobacterium sp. 2YAF39]|uniref:amino acid ABC transporter permease n=1 Tax=Mycobacterium sp. 2YAF39 TaxID=3233033 RepID=UPI003F945B7C
MSGSSILFDAPGPRAKVRNYIATGITVLAFIAVLVFVGIELAAKGQLEWAKWEPFITPNVWENYLIPGIEGTLKAAGLSIVLAGILGVVLGVGRLSTHSWINKPCAVFVEFFRAVPVLIMMIFAYFLYSRYDVFASEYSTLAGVVTGLTLYNGAVIAEIVRAGVNALPRGQSEAASSLGMRWGQTMRSILLPQAITSMLPVLISQLVVVLKDTALGVAITYPELVSQGTNIGASFTNLLPALVVIAVLMIVVNFTLSSFAVWLEARLRRSRRAPTPLDPGTIEQEGAPGATVKLAEPGGV